MATMNPPPTKAAPLSTAPPPQAQAGSQAASTQRSPSVLAPFKEDSPHERIEPLDRNKFEDEFPVMFKFYRERGLLPEFHMQKVQEIQRRWKTGLVFWLTHDNQETEIPEWVAVNVVINNKQNVQRGARICMSLNHTKGYGCNRRNDGACSYVHECALCGQEDHGVFQKRQNGSWVCNKLRKWNGEEAKFQSSGYGDPWKQEEVLTEMARKTRGSGAPTTRAATPTAPPPRVIAPSAADWIGGSSSNGSASLAGTKAAEGNSSAILFSGGVASAPSAGAPPDGADDANAAPGGVPALAPPPAQPPPPRLPSEWQAIWSDEQAHYYYWHRPTNHTTWELPDSVEDEVSRDPGASSSGNGQIPETGEEETQPPTKVEAEGEIDRHFICTKSWRPKPGIESCIRIIQGDRVVMTWASGEVCGWAYGHVVDDSRRMGYFPRDSVVQAHEEPRSRPAGELCTVRRSFEGPEEVSGYLTVTPGDVLRILSPMEPPYVWAYVERAGGHEPVAGWVPEAVLKDVVYAH